MFSLEGWHSTIELHPHSEFQQVTLYHNRESLSSAELKKGQSTQKKPFGKAAFERKNYSRRRAHADQKFAESSYFAHLHGKCKIFAKAIDKSLLKWYHSNRRSCTIIISTIILIQEAVCQPWLTTSLTFTQHYQTLPRRLAGAVCWNSKIAKFREKKCKIFAKPIDILLLTLYHNIRKEYTCQC